MGYAIGDAARSVSEIAAAHQVSWPTAHRRFVALAEQSPREPTPVRVLGIDETRRGIEYVVIAPAAVYAAAVRTPDLLPNAVLVVDHFRLVAKADDAVTQVRQRVTWDQRSGRRLDPEWANQRRLLHGRERMSDSSVSRMFDVIDAQDPSAQILSVYVAEEKLRTLLSTAKSGGDRGLTSQRLIGFFTWRIDSRVQELITLAVIPLHPRTAGRNQASC